MKTLAIETSCDDTSLSIVDYKNGFFNIKQCVLYSQIEKHKKYGGVVPELASRLHEQKIIPILDEIGIEKIKKTDFISYTCCPGLPGSLLIGKTLGNTLSLFLEKEKISINHIHGHIFSIFAEKNIKDIEFPMITLTVSGGHNNMYLVSKKNFKSSFLDEYINKISLNYNLNKNDLIEIVGDFKIYKIGFTLDDAAGECFDKVSKMLGGPYPGGKRIYDNSKKHKFNTNENIFFARIWLKKNEFNFSFSGLKAKVFYEIKKMKEKYGYELPKKIIYQISYEFQESAIEILGKKLLKASKYFNMENISLVGGVSANSRLKEYISQNKEKYGLKNFYSPIKNLYSTDNAAMIGIVGIIKKIS